MSDPATVVTSKDHCSVINDEVLYVFSEKGMQSLPLKKGGKWSDLPMGVSVTGGQCVLAPADDKSKAAMYIVGGAANSSTSDYTGLQRYTFASKKWNTIKPLVTVTQNRRNHGAAYLKDSASILVYAGSQDTADPTLSSQTFLISTSPPYDVQSYTSSAPPLTQPQVMTWNDSHAVLVGGGSDNKEIFTFGQQEGWADLGTTLKDGLQSHSTMGCDIVMGDDGSKVLETYDLSQSPNQVARIVLWADGQPAKPGQTVGGPSSSTSSRKRKRDSGLTLDNWPAYNDSLAPTLKRNGYAIASDGAGLAVISGGAAKDAIAVFNQRQNEWVDPTKLLGSQAPLSVSSASSSTARPTSTSNSASSLVPPTSSSSSAPTGGLSPPDGDSHNKTLTVLGATLGTIFGIAAILIIILLLLRWKREKRKRAQGGYLNEKDNDRLSFADQGTEFMHTAGGSVGHHYSASMNNSVTSLNIIAGKTKGTKSAAHKRNGGALGSDASTAGLIPQRNKPSPLAFNDSVEMAQMKSEKGIATSPRLVNIPSPKATRAPPATVGDPSPLSPGALRAARGQAAMTSRPISRGNDGRPGSSGSVSRGGAIVAGMGGAGAGASRSSGWSKYFTNNDHTTNLMGVRKGSVGSEASRSEYTRGSGATGSQVTYPSQTVQPLQLDFGPKFDSTIDGQRLSRVSFSRVASGSPTLGHSRDHSNNGKELETNGRSAELARAASAKSGKSGDSVPSLDYFGSTAPGTANTWTPVSSSHGWNDFPPIPAHGHQQQDSFGSSVYSRQPQSLYPAYDDRRNLYTKSTGSNNTIWPAPPKSSHGAEDRDSTTTTFPRGFPDSPGPWGIPPVPSRNGDGKYGYGQGVVQQPAKKVPVGEDVSWLNLNAGATPYS